ncbi:hypothetical protein [Streptomyces sp. NPDC006446]
MKAAVVRAFGEPLVGEARHLAYVIDSIDRALRGEVRARIVFDLDAGR